MAILKSNDCGGLSVSSGGGTTVNVTQTNSGGCGCGCGGRGTSTGGGGDGTPTPTGGTGGGTGGHPGDGTNGGTGGNPPGSGDGGSPNTDGGDKLLVPSACIPVAGTVNKDFGSSGFELVNYDFTTALITACKTAPGYEEGDKIISAKVSVDGLAYGGAAVFGTQPLVQNRKLSVTDAQNNIRKVAFTEEVIGAGILNFVGWRYQDQFPVYIDGGTVKIDGQMPSSLIPDVNFDKNSPAWLKVKVCSVVTHKDNAAAFDFNRWNALVAKDSNELYDIHKFATFKFNDTHEQWNAPNSPSGNVDYPNYIQPVNDSSNYAHYWPIILGQKPIAAGKTHIHIGGKYSTHVGGQIMQLQLFEQTTVGGTYYAKSPIMEVDFAVTSGANVADYAFDADLLSPTTGVGLWYLSMQIGDYQIGIEDMVGAFS